VGCWGLRCVCRRYSDRTIACFDAARERIVGFYSSGPKIKPADMAVEALFRSYAPAPVMVIIDVRPECEEIPTTAYIAVDRAVEVGVHVPACVFVLRPKRLLPLASSQGKEVSRVFEHVPCEVGAYEAEEV
jgi:26S proteasome regulatory subunit N8